VNRLQKRLTHIERAILPAGRMCAVIDDGSEDIEARIARCKPRSDVTSAFYSASPDVQRQAMDAARAILKPWDAKCGRAPAGIAQRGLGTGRDN
jgi:hypothetical protein